MFLLLVALVAHAGDASGGFDHTHADLDAFLDGAVDARGVDYALLATRRGTLDRYLAAVAEAPVASFSDAQKLALYVNAYNAHTLAMMLDAGPPASIRDLDGGNPWDARRFVVGGEQLTLNQMEHERARKLADGRVHAVVNCASRGCPPLPPDPLVAEGLDAQLDAAAARWASTNAFAIDGQTVALSRIFDWYGEDFADAAKGDLPRAEGKQEAALWWLVDHVDAATAETLRSGLEPRWAEYDWSLNRR